MDKSKREFTNIELKNLIFNLITDNHLTVDENITKIISKSSKTHYDTLYKYYNEIKNSIIENLINNKSSNENKSSNDNIEIIEIIEIKETKEIGIQTDICYEDSIKLYKELFNCHQLIANQKYTISEMKKQYKIQFKKFNNNNNSNYNSSSDDEFKEKRTINYVELSTLSSVNIINELQKLSRHHLKQVYNKYFSSKLQRMNN